MELGKIALELAHGQRLQILDPEPEPTPVAGTAADTEQKAEDAKEKDAQAVEQAVSSNNKLGAGVKNDEGAPTPTELASVPKFDRHSMRNVLEESGQSVWAEGFALEDPPVEALEYNSGVWIGDLAGMR